MFQMLNVYVVRSCRFVRFQALSSDHLPILTTIHTNNNISTLQKAHTFTNFNKANWEHFTQEIENIISGSSDPTNTHTANKIITNAILLADKHNIPKGQIKTNHQIIPKDIQKSRQETKKDPTNPNINTLTDQITKEISTHKSKLWKDKLNKQWDHKQNTQIFWNTIKRLSNKKPTQQYNRTITFNNKLKTTKKTIEIIIVIIIVIIIIRSLLVARSFLVFKLFPIFCTSSHMSLSYFHQLSTSSSFSTRN